MGTLNRISRGLPASGPIRCREQLVLAQAPKGLSNNQQGVGAKGEGHLPGDPPPEQEGKNEVRAEMSEQDNRGAVETEIATAVMQCAPQGCFQCTQLKEAPELNNSACCHFKSYPTA